MQVAVSITGDRQMIKKLEALGPRLQEFGAAFTVLGRELPSYYAGKVFASQGGALDGPWKPLSPVYAARKGKMYPGRGILSATGNMQRSFTARVTPTMLIIGNDAPYFKYHQSSEERKKMPRRPMLGINEEVRSIVRMVIESDIQQKIKGL